jgi:hypothetical protein
VAFQGVKGEWDEAMICCQYALQIKFSTSLFKQVWDIQTLCRSCGLGETLSSAHILFLIDAGETTTFSLRILSMLES